MASTTARGVVTDGSGPAAPTLTRVASEALAGLDAARLLRDLPRLALRRRGVVPRDVLVLPGWYASDTSTVVLRRALERDGHRVRGWGRGRNRGDVEAHVRAIVEVVVRRVGAVGAPLDLVGQSLGGVIAREVARRRPGAVRRVVTFGTPLLGPTGTVFGPWFDGGGRRRTPPPVPTTIIWSKRDGIVDWRAQRDDHNPWAEHVEVGSRHLGMGVDPAVIETVRARVAADAGRRLRHGAPSTDPTGGDG